jgi:DNA-binding Lrp family transcriptional regulator
MTSFDRLDAEIIGRLEHNARIGVAQLASDLGVSRNTIQARMTRLEESGALRGLRPDVDLAAIGLPVQAYINLEVDQRRLNEIIEGLEAVPEILEAHTQAGREDISVLVASSSVSDLQRIAIDLVNISGVRHTYTNLIIKAVVPYRVWPLLDRHTSAKGWGRSTPLPPPR